MIRVPAPVLDALTAEHQIDRQDLVYLGGGREESDGILYTFRKDDHLRVLKIVALSSKDRDGLLRMQERLKFVRFLGEHGADIVYPIARQDGSLFALAHSDEHVFVAYVMEKISGYHISPNNWNSDFIGRWGKTVGRLHRLSQQYPTWKYSVADPDTGRTILGWREEWESFYHWCRDAQVKGQWKSVRERLEELPIERDSFGFIHNDPHAQNILVTFDRTVLLDFDVANYHWFINDIAIALQTLLFARTGGLDRPLRDRAAVRDFLDTFMGGYESENHLADFWLTQVDLFISYRRILMFTVMQNWLQKKPSYKRVLKDMILNEPPVLNL